MFVPESNSEALSTVNYWDTVLRSAKLPRINKYRDYFITMKYMDSVLATESGKKTLMEVGAGSSGWLPYFAKKYGFLVSGLDYSEVGCRIAEENLKMQQIAFDEIICEDIFNWKPGKTYDVIFSYGVIEHFEHPERILKIIYDHVSPDGLIITLVPNLTGVMGSWSRRFVPEIYKIHKVIDRGELRSMHEQVGFHNVTTDYVGTFSIGVIPWVKSTHFLFRPNSVQRRISLFMISAISRSFGLIERMLGSVQSRKFSPYVVSIMRKP